MSDTKLNSDASMTPDIARALHRVVRAMHDGNCPKCGMITRSSDMTTDVDGWQCPGCEFSITTEEGRAAMSAFRPFMEANVAVFEKWRKLRVIE